MKPRIAIPIPNSDETYSARTLPQYVSAVERAGGEAVPIPLNSSLQELAQQMKTCDGVLLPGSPADVDPQKYGASERDPRTAPADPARDNVDELLLQDAHNMRKPLLGICYGVQSLNVWRQGTLIQHLETPVSHARPQGAPKTVQMRHAAEIEPDSRVAAAIQAFVEAKGPKLVLEVNSTHHQAVDAPGDGLRIVARSPQDGVVEAVEGTRPEHWVVGVQWHPERSYDEDEPSKAIFRAFIEAARKWHNDAQRQQDFETVR